jgi:hypothetical protein
MNKIVSGRMGKKAALVALAFVAAGANAAGFADIVAAVSFTDVAAAVVSIGVLVIGVDLAQLGYMKVRRLVKGAH